LPKKEIKITELTQASEKPDIWDHPDQASKILKDLETLRSERDRFQKLLQASRDLNELITLDPDAEEEKEIENQYLIFAKEAGEWEFQTLLGGKYDANHALLTIRSGAGGTEAQDWAAMLLRMYLRYAEGAGYATKILDSSEGSEAGIKNATIEIAGRYAYGYLQGEAGVHRLVRLSPFNANNLRQTSFASVEVLPVIEDTDTSIVIRPEDLRVDTYRSQGAGGQNVNKTESAVRLTHLESGIVVACQSERSQLQNKTEAMKMLRAKLYEREEARKLSEKIALKGEQQQVEFGSQIRSYVLHPYKMVKDHRTDVETSDPDAVLNGDLDSFIKSELQYLCKKEK
jgi:peptide chain release factor 2